MTQHQQMIAERTNELAEKLGITDQLAHMSTALEKLTEIERRLSGLTSLTGQKMHAMCQQMVQMAEKHNA